MVSAAGCDEEETQVLDLDSTAPGNCPLDGFDTSDGEGVGGIDERGKTQLVTEYGDTAVADSGDEETDRTQVLSGDDEGFLDDAGDAFGPEHVYKAATHTFDSMDKHRFEGRKDQGDMSIAGVKLMWMALGVNHSRKGVLVSS
ncbi:hypothetical protein BHM03_00053225 [Ensete ventricosum]|nr:hypothetical protein BHM03_00053225 [Ensete ventricosum]